MISSKLRVGFGGSSCMAYGSRSLRSFKFGKECGRVRRILTMKTLSD